MYYKTKAKEVAKDFSEDSRVCGLFLYLEKDRNNFAQYYAKKNRDVSFNYSVSESPNMEAFIKDFLLEYTSSKKNDSQNLGRVVTIPSLRKAQKLLSTENLISGISEREASHLLSDFLGVHKRLQRRFRKKTTMLIINLDYRRGGFSKETIDFVYELLAIPYHSLLNICIVSSMKELLLPLGLMTPEEYHANKSLADAGKYIFNITEIPPRIRGNIKILDENFTVLDQFQARSSRIEIDGQKYHQISDDVKILIYRLGDKLRWGIVDIENSFRPIFSNTLLPGTTEKVKNKRTHKTEFLVNFDCEIDKPNPYSY